MRRHDSACKAGLTGVAHGGRCTNATCPETEGLPVWQTTVTAQDGCNTCRCVDGELHCTTRVCTRCEDDMSACGDDAYCHRLDGNGCVADGGAAFCMPRPIECRAGEFSPACGCDGVMYDDYCQAAKAGVDSQVSSRCME